MNKKDREHILSLLKTGKSYEDICEILNTSGLLSETGRSWNTSMLSFFATRKLKYRRKMPHRRQRVAKNQSTSPAPTKAKLSVDESLTMDILTSNMSKKNKLSLLERLL